MNYSEVLLKQDRNLFHTSDLALLWEIDNKNTLYTTIKRYVQKEILIPIHKGFYSTKPLRSIDSVELGVSYVHDYAYLSTESVLSMHGVINQLGDAVTLVSAQTKKFSLLGTNYIVRAMRTEFLHNNIGIDVSERGYCVATPERAAADMLYYSPNYHFDNEKRLDRDIVDKIIKEIGFK